MTSLDLLMSNIVWVCSYMKENFEKKIIDLDMLTQLDIKEHAVIERWRYIEKNREEEFKKPKDRFSSV